MAPSAGNGGQAGSGTANGGAGAPSAGQSNGGSASGSAGMAGTGAGGAGGSNGGGNGGASGGSGGSPGCAPMGTQADPGSEGDGKLQLDAPYQPAPESTAHLDGALKGKVNDVEVGMAPKVLIYEQTKQYPGVNNMLKNEYWIYVPAQYKPGCAAALMVFQDGVHYVGVDDAKINAPTVFDNLIAKGEMPVTIGVFINPGEPGDGHYNGNEYQNRHVQYDKNDPAYVTFLVEQFLPDVVLPKYDIVADPDGWAISGHSSGGIAAFMAGWHRPDKFRKLLTHSASFPLPGDYMGMSLIESIDAKEKQSLRVYLMSGPNDLGGWFGANTTAAEHLAAKGYHYQYRTEDSNHYPPQAAAQDFANALRWMWRGYTL
jgi:enterochelin esterase-like enzyme